MEHVLLFRNIAVTTAYSNFYPVLLEYGSHDRRLRIELATRLGLSGGQSDRIFHDMKLLGLLDKDLRITMLGRQWQREIQLAGNPEPESLRAAALNVPLFQMTLRALGDDSDPERIVAYFRERTGPETRSQDIGCARRRYLEAFFPQPLPRALRKRVTAAQRQVGVREPAAMASSVAALPQQAQLVAEYVQLMEKYGPGRVAACHQFLYEEEEK